MMRSETETVIATILYFQMSNDVSDVSKYDLNDLQTDHILHQLHQLEWHQIFLLVSINKAFHKMIYKMRGRNMIITPQLDKYWKVIDRFPYLENVSIMEDFGIEFRNKLRRLQEIKRLRIHCMDFVIDYITSKTLEAVEVSTSNRHGPWTVDHLINILSMNGNIRRLVYTNGFISNESIYYMMRNRIDCLKFGNVHTEHATIINEYLTYNKYLRKLTILGVHSGHMQGIIFMKRKQNRNHIIKITVHVLNTEEVEYTSIGEYRGLRSISLYFCYGPMANLNLLNILNALRDATYLRYIRIYRIDDGSGTNENQYSFFHDEVNSYIDFFEARDIDIFTCTRLYN